MEFDVNNMCNFLRSQCSRHSWGYSHVSVGSGENAVAVVLQQTATGKRMCAENSIDER